jgi:ribonucleotide reductase alpha subunit
MVNENLMHDLLKLNLWNQDIKDEFMLDNGSIQNIREIPDDIKEVYLTSYEMKQSWLVQQSIERGPFIDQSQSLNIFMNSPDSNKLTACHFYGWRNGLKTGMYYLRSQPAVDPIKFGLDPDKIAEINERRERENRVAAPACVLRPGDKGFADCESCSG